MMDPAVQTDFARNKGSVPSRLDANIAVLDRCANQGQQVMAMGPAHQLPHFCSVFTPDSYGSTSICSRRTGPTRISAADATKKFARTIAGAGH
jgi:glucose/mannose transport system substrate-binding protein